MTHIRMSLSIIQHSAKSFHDKIFTGTRVCVNTIPANNKGKDTYLLAPDSYIFKVKEIVRKIHCQSPNLLVIISQTHPLGIGSYLKNEKGIRSYTTQSL